MALGTLVAPWPVLAVAAGGVVATVAAAACLAARVGPPREYFVIFSFLIATALPEDPGAAPARAGLVLLGVAAAWCVSMAGALRDAHRPQRAAVDGAFRALARFLDVIGREGAGPAQHEAVVAVRRALAAVDAAGPVDRAPARAALAARAEGAEGLLEAGLALVVEGSPALDPQWGRSVAALAEGPLAAVAVPPPAAAPSVPAGARLHAALRAVGAMPGAWAIDEVVPAGGRAPRWRASLAEVLDRQSAVRIAALRVGIAVGVAGAAGYLLRAEHPGWIPLSTAAVLQGTNVALARQRALHRAAGTAVGVVLAAGVLALEPGIAGIVVLVAVFQALTEALILVSYGVAVVCITSLALLLLDLAGVGTSVGELLDARLLDTALGCAIGLAAGLLLWPRRSRERLAGRQADTIRAAAGALRTGVTGGPADELRRRRRAVHVAVVGLDLAQRDATGDDLQADPQADRGWPVTRAVQQLAFVAMALPRLHPAPLGAADAERLDAALLALADRAEGGAPAAGVAEPPAFEGLEATRRAVAALQDALAEFTPPRR
jgi:uncharacterized membrane protein YccC